MKKIVTFDQLLQLMKKVKAAGKKLPGPMAASTSFMWGMWIIWKNRKVMPICWS